MQETQLNSKSRSTTPILGYSTALNLSLLQFISLTAASLILTATQKNYFHFRYGYTMDFATGLNYFSAIAPPFIGIFGAWIADEKIGRYPVLKWSCLLTTIGYGIWWSSSFADFMIWPSLILVGIGSIGAPARLIYGADQLEGEKDTARYWTLIYFLTNIASLAVIITIGSRIPSWKAIGHNPKPWQILYAVPPLLALIAAIAMFQPVHKHANHNIPKQTGYASTMAGFLRRGHTDPEFSTPLQKLFPLGLIYMIWCISENLGNTAFDSQALTMQKPFDGWPDIGNQLFDGISSITATIIGELLLINLRNHGWNLKSNRLIAFALSVSVMAMIYFAALQYFIALTWLNQGARINLFLQLPLWFLSRTSEFIMATVLPAYVYKIAHPSQKSLTFTTVIDIANALSAILAALMFVIFDKCLRADISANGMPLNYNAMWQSIIIGILSLGNLCLFYTFVGTENCDQAKDPELDERLLQLYDHTESEMQFSNPFFVLHKQVESDITFSDVKGTATKNKI